jgi:stage II sporulation protein D
MSQWGADGYAQHGWSYRAILAHYYSGTTVATHAAPLVHVLLLDGRKRVTLASDSPWQVTDALGHKLPLAAGPLAVGADLLVAGEALASPLVFSPGRTPLRVGKAAYRGKLMLVSTGKRLQVVNALPLESYLLGVVGEEMPHTWPAAALEAQAVAARSYALAELENVVTARAYDLFGDTRSQVYGGIAGESPEVTAAVRATAHQAVLYAGKVATTYFFSTSGGKTASAADVWGKPAPYLVSVADPYDTLSPYHDWGPVLLDARKAGRALQAPGDLVALDLTPDPAGRVARVSVVGTNGTVTATGTAVRTALGLRSSWFTVGWLALAPPAAPLPYGQAASLSGLVRGLAGASLEVKAGSAWQPVMPVTPGSDGSFTVALNPTGTAEYRLSAGAAATAPVKLTVAPAVSATLAAGTVEGSVRPALSGAAIQLQRQDGAAWRTVATATTDTAGSFAVAAQLPPGSYRVRCAPGHGLSPGVSPPILQT